MGQTRRERKLRSSSFTGRWIVWTIRIKAHTGLQAAWFFFLLHLPQMPTSHSQRIEWMHLPQLHCSGFRWSQDFLFQKLPPDLGFLLGPVHLLLEGGSSCWEGRTDPFTKGRQMDWLTRWRGDSMKPSQNFSSLYLLLRYNYGWWWLTGALS